MTTPTDAEIVSTNDSLFRFPEMWMVQIQCMEDDPYSALFALRDDADECAKDNAELWLRTRVFRIPSEQEVDVRQCLEEAAKEKPDA